MLASILTLLLLAGAPDDRTEPLPAASTPAWAGYPYPARSVEVNGHPISYVDVGAGDPILLLHGIPTHGYLWRNVIPHLEGRVVVPDLPGFGRSYQGAEFAYDGRHQQEHFDAFMDALDLRDVTLVVNDLGSLLGLHWAARHPDRVKAIVLVEAAMLDAESWWKHLPFKMKLMFRLMHDPKRAEKFIVDANIMVERMIPKVGTERRLTPAELAAYRTPFRDPAVRRRVLLPLGPAAMPARGRSSEPWDAAGMMNSYAGWLRDTPIPKLLLWARPGLIAGPGAVRQARKSFVNLTAVELGRGVHFLPEDHPAAIGKQIAAFVARLGG